jgi:peptidyl-tRNA hydrolase, PTH1 family
VPALRLIAGLGNPGPQYEHTPHNAGVWFVEMLSRRFAIALVPEAKFKGRIGRGTVAGHDVRLLIPSTFMNLSGESVGAVAQFYKIMPSEVLIAHDELDFDAGIVRLKLGGKTDTHNGVADIVRSFGNDGSFTRLRICVGHPGERSRVSGYLTSTKMRADDRQAVIKAIDLPDAVIASIVDGDMLKAMNVLHTSPTPPEAGAR